MNAVYCSPRERAVRTATAIAAPLGIAVTEESRFDEIDLGEWTGRRFDQLRDCGVWHNYNSFRSATRIPSGETMLEVQSRVLTAIEDLRCRHPGERIAVVSHADVIKAALSYFLGIAIDLSQRMEVEPASISCITLGDDFAKVTCINRQIDRLI